MMSVDDPVMSHLKWLVVFGAFGSFLFGYGTGSNDVANAFGTSVGSRTLTLRQAVVIAAIFEFGGAMLLGRVSTSTIAGGIADIKSFQREPEVSGMEERLGCCSPLCPPPLLSCSVQFYAFGMVIAVTVSGIWNIVASYLEFNVSSTHSIIGSIMGFSLVFGGGDAVKWAVPDPNRFPPYKGVVPIILAWFISPIFTSIAAGILFLALRTFVLRRQNGNIIAFWLLPFLVMITVYICVFFVFTRGIKKTLAKDGDWNDAKSAWVSAVVAAGCAVLTAVVVLPILKARAKRLFKEHIPVTDATGELGMVDKAAIVDLGNEPSGASFTQDGKAAVRNGNSMMPSYDANGGMVATGYHMMTPEEREAAIHKARLDAVEKAKAKQLQRDEEEKQKHQEHLAKLKAKEAGEVVKGPGFMGTLSNVRLWQLREDKMACWDKWMLGQMEWTEYSVLMIVMMRISWTSCELQVWNKTKKAILHGTSVDVHEVVEDDPLVAAIHANAEHFDPKVEYTFSYLQVFSAICVVFAHGAGEVGYMAGPMATVWQAYTECGAERHCCTIASPLLLLPLWHTAAVVHTVCLCAISVAAQGKLTSSVTAPVWIVLIGALGLVIGLATCELRMAGIVGSSYEFGFSLASVWLQFGTSEFGLADGYNVTRSMGVRLAKLSPSRGFCAELSTALVILVCSQYGLPTSSSQVITGGIIGVGLTVVAAAAGSVCALQEGTMGVNWRFFALQFSTWVSTLFVCGLGTAAIFALGVYSPGIIEGAQVELYEDRISNLTQHLYRSVNTELVPFRGAAAAGTIPTLSNATWTSLNRSTLTNAAAAKAATGTSRQTVPPEEVLGNLYRALALVQQTSVSTVGQARVFPGATNPRSLPWCDARARCEARVPTPATMMSVDDPVMSHLKWLVVFGAFGSFLFGYGTAATLWRLGCNAGSNDVANAFGTSVGSRTLTLRQAVVVRSDIAAIFEFGGAMLLGRVSTSTIAGGIADIKSFQREPEVTPDWLDPDLYVTFGPIELFYAFGMVIAVTVSGIWNILASYLEFNVSATHSIIGSIMGFSLVFGGGDAVKWAVPDPTAFPPYKGVVPIILAWFISPIFTSIAAGLLFMALRMAVLRRQNGNTLAFWLLPFLVMLTVYICVFFVFTRGIKKTLAKGGDWDDAKSAWVTAIIAAGCGVLTAVVVLPILKSRANRLFKDHIPVTDATGELGMVDKASVVGRGNEPSGASFTQDGKAPARNDNSMMPSYDANGGMVATGYHMMTPEEREAAIHKARLDAVEKAKAKQLMRDEEEKQRHQEQLAKLKAKEAGEVVKGPGFMGTLSMVWSKVKKAVMHGTSVDIHEVFSAICVVFAHGAGEVGYMAGPLATVWQAYTELVLQLVCCGEALRIHVFLTHWAVMLFAATQGKLTSSVTAPVWIVLIGAIGLVIGLATYGYNVTRSMGVRLAKLSPSRGFCAELSTALVILVCSQYGLPTSSSQVITGGIIGVGLTEGTMGVNWRFFALQFSTWVSTLFVCGLGTAAIFALGVYSPGIVEGAQVELYEDRISNLTQHLYRSVNTELVPFRGAAAEGTIPTLSNATWTSLNRSTLTNAAAAKAATGTTRQTVPPEEVLGNLYRALALVQQTSVSTVGQARVFPGATNVCNGPAGPDAPAACRAPRLLPAAFNSTFPI
ncbi:hypothetical protein QJQ45_021537 [Haematococcus lacustris]|nr:hypothetical protein QJQ45_021537 [Haematococcus lacustris]